MHRLPRDQFVNRKDKIFLVVQVDQIMVGGIAYGRWVVIIAQIQA